MDDAAFDRARIASRRFHQMTTVIDAYCEENNLQWLGCMENNDELTFCPRGETATIVNMTTMWWIRAWEQLGTFEEYRCS